MAVAESQTSGRTAVQTVLVANLLPLVCALVFEWRIYRVLFVYWVEIGATLLLYFGVVLFAQRESNPDRKRGGSYPGPISFPRRSGSIRPFSGLPAVRYQNIRYIPAAFVTVTVVWAVASRLFLEYSNTDITLESRAFGEYAAYFVAAYSPEGLALAAVLFGVKLVFVSRDFFGSRLVDRYSAAMLMEIPCRIVLFWFAILVALTPVSLLVAASDANPAIASGLVAAVVVASKLAVDRSLIRVRHLDDPGSFASLFAPNELNPEVESETTASRSE